LYFFHFILIKEGDWMFIDEKGTERNPGRGYILKQHKGDAVSKLNAVCSGTVKIIATTDKSLGTIHKGVQSSRFFQLPQIPEFFIKLYVERQGEVGDVWLVHDVYEVSLLAGSLIVDYAEKSGFKGVRIADRSPKKTFNVGEIIKTFTDLFVCEVIPY